MSESLEGLKTAVEGKAEALVELKNTADQLSSHAKEFAEEAAEHGWNEIASRMKEAAEALQAAAGGVETARTASANAAEELGLIDDKIPAAEVVTHLTAGTTRLGEGVAALAGAMEKAGDAQAAVEEVGQEGMMEATSDLEQQLTEVHEQLVQHEAASESERAAADAYVKKQLGN